MQISRFLHVFTVHHPASIFPFSKTGSWLDGCHVNHHYYTREDFKTSGFQNMSGPSQPAVVIFEKRSKNIFSFLPLCDSEMRLNEICWRVNHTLKLVFCLETNSFGKPFYQYLTSGKCTDSSTILTRPLFKIPFLFNNNLPKINSKC